MESLNKDAVLAFLDPDPRRSEQEYARLRAKLIRYFTWNRCRCPEDCADETFLRVWKRVTEGAEIHASNPDGYVYGVAANILKEDWKRPADTPIPAEQGDSRLSSPGGFDWLESKMELDQVLRQLPSVERALLVRYYSENPPRLAQELGIDLKVLRVRIHRIKEKVRAESSGKTGS